jgi:hypothetical protein
MRQIYLASNRMEADLLCDELRQLGFEAVVQGDVAAIPSAPFPSIWVPTGEAAAAAAAMRQMTPRSEAPES